MVRAEVVLRWCVLRWCVLRWYCRVQARSTNRHKPPPLPPHLHHHPLQTLCSPATTTHLKPRQRLQQRKLKAFWKPRGKPLNVQLRRRPTLWFQKDLV